MRSIDADALYDEYQKEMTRLLTSTNIENMSAEALSLLCGSTLIRAAPTIITKARLLTLEEADKADCVWIEIKPHTMIGVRRIRLVPTDSTACMIYSFNLPPSCHNTCIYGIEWRCWSNKPTMEQMEKVEWNEN